MVTVYDNFAPPEYFEQLSYLITGPYQTWYYQDNIVGNFWGKDQLGKHGLNCWIVEQPNVFADSYAAGLLTNLVLQMKNVINRENVLRSRLDMTFYSPIDTECYPHIDDIIPHIATIFYFNDSDGNTVIYNEKYDSEDGIYSSKVIKEKKIKLTVQKEIEPRANRLVAFDGSYIHTGHVPCKHNNRIILNSNFN